MWLVEALYHMITTIAARDWGAGIAQWWEHSLPTNMARVRFRPILVPRAHHPSGLQQGSRALGWSNTGSPRFTDFPSNLANLIGWEYETNTLRMLRKASPARARDLCRRPEGWWALGTRMIPARCHMWVESVVGSRFAPTVFLWELQLSAPSWKTKISKF